MCRSNLPRDIRDLFRKHIILEDNDVLIVDFVRPDISFKGGIGIAGYPVSVYPSIKLADGGYGLAIWGASASWVPNPMEVLVDSGSGSFWVLAGSNTSIRAWASGNVAIGTSALPIAPLDVHATAQSVGAARRNVASFDTSIAAQGVGGGIAFGGNYSSANASTPDFANIWGIKENGTDNDNAGALLFATHGNGGTPVQRRLDLRGNDN
jgi:hypothetical protein